MSNVVALLERALAVLESIPTTAALVGLCLVLSVPMLRDRSFAVLVVALYTVPLSRFAPSGLSDVARVLVLFLGVIRMLTTKRFGNAELRVALGSWRRILVASTVFVPLSVVWSTSPSETLAAAIGLVSLAVLLWSASPDGVTARRAVEGVLWIVVVLSVVSFPLADSWVAGRFRGVMANANGLAAFLVVAGLLSLEAKRFALSRTALCGGLLFLTGSRSGALAFVVGLAVLAVTEWRRQNVTARGLAWSTALTGVVAIGLMTIPYERLPWRTKDTRSEVWSTSFGLVRDHAVLGLGGGAFPTESGSSYLRVLGEFGIVGTALCVFALITTMRLRDYSAPQLALLFGLAVHMIFEGWFLVGGSAIFLALVATTATGSRQRWPSPVENSDPSLVSIGRLPR